MAELMDFNKDDAAQQLLGLAGIDEPYEVVIEQTSLEILRQSVPSCVIERIRFVRSAGSHPGFRADGTKLPENATQIVLQKLTLPFDLEIDVRAGTSRHLLKATFVFECSKLDGAPQAEFLLEVHSQWNVGPDAADATA